jgi:methyltransferase (TIGR00027 family)
MEQGQPSQTALAAAGHRAAHQVLEHGSIFSDPLAVRILGADAAESVRRAASDPSLRRLRLFIAVRTRFAEDALAAALACGLRQLVVVGAGLDTYAYRSTAAGLRIFEVDHPATQSWKRARLEGADIEVPPALTFVPVDFECGTLEAGLRNAGFDFAQPAFFTWLGVVPYLTESAVFSTLGFIAGLSSGAEVVFDYANPIAKGAKDEHTAAHEALAARVARIGEPFKCYLDTEFLRESLAALRFTEVNDLGPAQIRARYFANRGARTDAHLAAAPDPADNRGGHIVHARRLTNSALELGR